MTHTLVGSTIIWKVLTAFHFWCVDPHNHNVHWVADVVPDDGSGELKRTMWHWHTEVWNGSDVEISSSYFGPFYSAAAAMADCEVAHR